MKNMILICLAITLLLLNVAAVSAQIKNIEGNKNLDGNGSGVYGTNNSTNKTGNQTNKSTGSAIPEESDQDSSRGISETGTRNSSAKASC